MPAWRFEVTDHSFVPQGEILHAQNRTVSIQLNKQDSCGLQIRLDNPMADLLLSTACYIKAYRDNVLRFYGPVISAEENSDDGQQYTIAITAAGAAWMFGKRLAGVNAITPGTSTLYTLTDRAAIFAAQLALSNSTYGTCGVVADANNTAASTVTYGVGAYRKLDEILGELSGGANGFDWRVLPIENYSDGVVTGQDIGTFYARPVIGVAQAEAVFEMGLGTRNNIASYKRTVNREQQANQVYHLTQTALYATKDESVEIFGTIEDVAQADLTDLSARQALVSSHIAARAYPRQVLQFVPSIDPSASGRLPRFGDDYNIGDFVPVRIVNNKTTRVDSLVRIWGSNFSIDNNGMERAQYVLADEG